MTVAAILTGASRAAVATIAVRGPDASQIVLAAFDSVGPGAIQTGQVRYGIWHGGDQAGIGESVVVSRNSDCEVEDVIAQSWEVHCHGGAVAAGRILDDLIRLGADVVDPWNFGNTSVQEQANWLSEANEVLSRTVSVRTAAVALAQVRGAMEEFVSESMRRIHELDASNTAVVADIALQASQILRFSSLGLHLSTPWRVVLAGPPNVGKSSLINALVGYQRSITVDMPGTTRDVLEAQTVIDGWPVRLSDTAGIRDDAESAIETAGIESAKQELQSADLILWVQDASETMTTSSDDLYEFAYKPTIQILNKIDRVYGNSDLHWQELSGGVQGIRTSATTGVGIDELRQAISNRLVPEVPCSGAPIPITSRQVSLLMKLEKATNSNDAAKFLRQLADVR